MTARRAVIAAAATALAALCQAAPTVTLTEEYSGTIDEAAWRVGTRDVIQPAGGHPDSFLRTQVDAAEPQILTMPAVAAPFLGDYRARGVTGLGVDIDLFAVGISADGRPVSLHLISDMGTPSDTTDDCEAVIVGARNLPRPGTGWKAFDFRVPSASASLPQGWIVQGFCAGLSGDDAWNAVIGNVTEARFVFGEPGFFYFFQTWDLGVDNPRITLATSPPAPA